jgi:hypothetical protein
LSDIGGLPPAWISRTLPVVSNFFTTLTIVCFAGGFLWGALKGKVYVNKPCTIQELETNIRREVSAISKDILQVTFANMQCRVWLCLDSGGGHFQHLL